ncbi:MAG TPA: helix-turn-helix transcriptional regulator [Burkholderiales bacterium]|nr:helix-turn-helix transcriptional regulator [Burkholderiales bacterium]
MLSRQAIDRSLAALHVIGEGCVKSDDFARRGVACLPRLVASELTTLSVCNLDSGHRAVVSDVPGALSARDVARFDHYFHEHPLVREHGRNLRAVTKRVDDLVPQAEFRESGLYNDYYRAIRIDHAMAMPIHVDQRLLVSFVFNRRGRGFADEERDALELIRPHLGNLYRLCAALGRAGWAPAQAWQLTPREHDVLRWLSAGKTDRDIGAILEISPRTVHKHLQRIYEKLGVETRTAAVARAHALNAA